VEQSLKIENLEKELQKVNAGIKECAEDLTSLSAQLNMRGKGLFLIVTLFLIIIIKQIYQYQISKTQTIK